MQNIGTKPAVEGLSPLDAAVLMGKYTTILGMINYGTKEQKEQAKREVEALEKYIYNHVNDAAFDLANRRLRFTDDELKHIESTL